MSLRFLAALAFAVAAAGCSDSNPVSPTPAEEAGPAPAPVIQPVTPTPPVPAPAPVTPSPTPAAATARYEVTFESTWRPESHPSDFPPDAHYSGLVGGTHASSVSFWRDGDLASEGIRRMAERGSRTPLTDEVQSAIGARRAEFVLSGGNLASTPGVVTMEFEVSQTFPLVTLVTMVAPSPDWFVGVSGLALFENGDWVSQRQVSLLPYDAGTDSGVTYRSADRETIPHQPIALITGEPMIYNGAVAPLGTFTFRRVP